jgi:hypothetical protein
MIDAKSRAGQWSRIRHVECVEAGRRLHNGDDRTHSPREALIRTLSVSIVAVAAVAASLVLSRAKLEPDTPRVAAAGGQQLPSLELDAIRAAGL